MPSSFIFTIQSILMRIILILVFAVATVAAKAQTAFTGKLNYYDAVYDSNHLRKNWSVSMYTGFSTGLGFRNGSFPFLSPSIGVQLNRRLNNNLYAFAGVSAGPALFYTGNSFSNAGYSNNFMTTPGFNLNQWGISKSIQAGLLYVNDAKTFSISGSIGVSNGSYPFRPVAQKRPAVIGSRQ